MEKYLDDRVEIKEEIKNLSVKELQKRIDISEKEKKHSVIHTDTLFKTDTVHLECSSCFTFLPSVPSKSVNLILIDPPYEVSRDTNFASSPPKGKDTDRFRLSMDFGSWDTSFTGLDTVVKECYRILKPHGTLICFYDLWKLTVLKNYFEKANFKQLRFIEWLKTNPVPLNSKTNYLTNSREIAILGVKQNKPTFNSSYDNGLYEEEGELYRFPICHDKNRFHPTQKPLDLIETLITKHSNKSDTVLDCFSGSGTTALACLNTFRSFVGCEIDPSFFGKSTDRLLSFLP